MTSSSPNSDSVLESLFHHVALPPRLPGKRDSNIKIETALIVLLINATRTFKEHTNNEFGEEPDDIHRILQTCRAMNSGGQLNKTSLLTQFRTLEPNCPLILHVTEQNAGLLIGRRNG